MVIGANVVVVSSEFGVRDDDEPSRKLARDPLFS